MGGGESSEEGGGAAGRGEGAGGRMGSTMGGGWAIRGWFPGPGLPRGVLGVLTSESGTTLLMTLWVEEDRQVRQEAPVLFQEAGGGEGGGGLHFVLSSHPQRQPGDDGRRES